MAGSTLNVANIATTLPMTTGSFAEIATGSGQNVLNFQIVGTYSGQIQVAVSIDGINFEKVANASITQVNGTTGLSANATGVFQCPVTAQYAIAYMESYTSGSATVTLFAGSGSSNAGQTGGGSTVTVSNSNQGYASACTETTPTVNNTTSTQVVAPGTYTNIVIGNFTGANIFVSMSNQTLTGIVPTSTNIGFPLAPGAIWQEGANGVTTNGVTVYHSLGSATNAIYVRVN